MTVKELISELQKMPPEATVVLWVKPGVVARELHSVEKRYEDMIFLNDIYYTTYAEEEEG